MNIAEAFVASLNLGEHQFREPLFSLTLTPRFPASRHVIFLLMPRDRHDPVLVAKVPRLPEFSDSIEREVRNLREIQALHCIARKSNDRSFGVGRANLRECKFAG